MAVRAAIDDEAPPAQRVGLDTDSSTVPPSPPSSAVVIDAATLLDTVGSSRRTPRFSPLGSTAWAEAEASQSRDRRNLSSTAVNERAPSPPTSTTTSSESSAAHGRPPTIAVPSRRQRRAARRLQARKVGRIVRHLDLWSVLKVAALFHLCAFLISLLAGLVVWSVGISTGVIADLEGFIRQAFALQSFAFDGERIFRAAVLGGLALVLAATAFTVLVAAVFNLISDLVGGIRVTVVQEETARPDRLGVLRTPAAV